MKYYALVFIVFFPLFAFKSFGQHDHKKHIQFKETLNEFRYSLYTDLDSMDSEFFILNKKFSEDHFMIKRIEDFKETNKQEIDLFQLHILQQYTDTKIDLSEYFTDPNYVNYRLDTLWIHKDNVHEFGNSFYEFWLCNDFDPVRFALYLTREIEFSLLSESEISIWIRKNNISCPLVKTEKIDNRSWKILIDYYQDAYSLEYDIKNRIVKSFSRYTRH